MSAIHRRTSPRPTLLVFEIDAHIAKEDIEAMAEQVEQSFDNHKTVDMLLIMAPFEGMDAAAAFDLKALGVQARSVRHVRKYAVVGAPGWARAMIDVSSLVSPVEAKTFDLAQEADAWTWVDEGVEAEVPG